MLPLIDFLRKHLESDDIRYLLKVHGLKSRSRASKEELIEVLLEAKPPGLRITLLHRFFKESLEDLCKRMGIFRAGTRAELEVRILDAIEWPYAEESYDIMQFDRGGRLVCRNVDLTYLFEKFHSTDDLRDYCETYGLPISGSKKALVERLRKSKNFDLVTIIERLDKNNLISLCAELNLPSKGTRAEILQLLRGKLTERRGPQQRIGTGSSKEEFDFALSFAGEDRPDALKIKEELERHGLRVFYDKDQEANLWGKDLYSYLSSIYSEKAIYCIMIISKAYAAKLWTSHERKSAQAKAFKEKREYILPVRLDDTEIEGLLETVHYLDLRKESHRDIASKAVSKLTQFHLRS